MITTEEERAQIYQAVEAVLRAQTGDFRRSVQGRDENECDADETGITPPQDAA